MELNLLTAKEFAAKLRVHPSTIRRAIESGRIHAFRVGNGKKASFRIPESEIERMMAFDLTLLIEISANKINENRSK